jgi:4-amino-4-deoxy-L-arabinose transferase-like glycosyltransferase
VRVSAVVVALATGLRLAWVLLVPTRPVGDFAMYLESAAHLLAHGALDPEFVYMPGYVLLLAAVKGLGGGLLAAKLVGVALGGAAAGAIYGITRALWDQRAALAAGLLYALWPAGVAVSSVTGTDLPAGALIVIAGWCLVRWAPARPLLAAVLFGAVMGAAAWIRAVALPLAALATVHLWALRHRWRVVVQGGALACLAAALVLVPWAVRNRLRYGETFFTDSHGGLTALVGANPNSEGRYSRSLNRMFELVTGHRLLAEPHRVADRASYQLARQFTRFEPAYAAGLVVLKAERLLANERPLLYWPLYRAGVLSEGQSRWFAAHRAGAERLVDWFWAFLVGATVLGLALAARRRQWAAFTFVPVQLGLIAIYALFFAEVRYQLPIVMLMFPPAGAAVAAVSEQARRQTSDRWRLRTVALLLAPVVALFALWPLLLHVGERLRARHRFAAHVCRVDGQARICLWRSVGEGDSPLRGVWDGLGLGRGAGALALELPAGRYRVHAQLDLAPVPPASARSPGSATVTIAGAAQSVALPALRLASAGGRVEVIEREVAHAGGALLVRLAVDELPGATRLWLGGLAVTPLGGAPR